MPIDLEAILARVSCGWGYVSDGVDTIGDAIRMLSDAASDATLLVAEIERLNTEAFAFREALVRPMEERQSRIEERITEVERNIAPRWIPTSERWPEPKTWFAGLEAIYTLSDALCLYCGVDRPAPGEPPCKERGEWGARKEWISVTDRLPPPSEGVIVQLAGERRDRCLAYVVEKARIDIDKPNAGPFRVLYVTHDWSIDGFTPEVTHWQRMPPPAATETKESQ